MANIEAAILKPPYQIREFLNSGFKFVISDSKNPLVAIQITKMLQ